MARAGDLEVLNQLELTVRSRIGEAVADPWLGEDVGGRGGVWLDLPAHGCHQHAQVLRLIDGVRPPDGLEDGAVGQDATRALRQVQQQLEFLRRQAHLFAIPKHPETFTVDDEGSSDNGVGRGRRIV